jgi:hypothetical protein
MALTNTPAWPQTPRYAAAAVTAANTATDGTGVITTLVTAGAEGMRVTGMYVGTTATVTATAVRIFLSTNGGTSWVYLPRLDRLVPPHTLTATTENLGRVTVVDQTNPNDHFDLPANAVLGVTIAVEPTPGGSIVAEALGADY